MIQYYKYTFIFGNSVRAAPPTDCLDTFDEEITSKLKALLMGHELSETDANDSIELLIKLRSS